MRVSLATSAWHRDLTNLGTWSGASFRGDLRAEAPLNSTVCLAILISRQPKRSGHGLASEDCVVIPVFYRICWVAR
jgi:hypothetical protein